MDSTGSLAASAAGRQAGARPPASRRWIAFEIALVLGLSLGQSAVYAAVSLLDKLSRAPLGGQTTSMNNPLSERPLFDLTYQMLDIVFALVPVALVFFLFAQAGTNGFRAMGLDFRRPWRDLGWGFGLFAVIGAGTLGVYAAGRALGATTAIVPSALEPYWWTIPVLVLSAVRHGLLEETVAVGYLFDRLRRLAWGPWAVVVASALLRGSYHLYQGFGPFVGNFLMGLVFGWLYLKYRRVMPLVIAHALLDTAGFVGYALIGPAIGLGT